MTIICIERKFECVSKSVCARFFCPKANGDDYECEYIIEIGDKLYKRTAVGIDSIEALFAALVNCHAELRATRQYINGELTWLGSPNLKMPIFVETGLLIEG
jgi:hypothetical protein